MSKSVYRATRDVFKAAAAKQQELERNAARYVWLRKQYAFIIKMEDGSDWSAETPEQLDVAIDNEIARPA